MDSSVLNELLKRESCDLTSVGIKAREGNCLGGIVNNKVYTGKGFDCTDVSTLSADNATLHFIIGKGNDRNGGFGNLIGCAALDSKGNVLAGLVLGLILCLCFDFLNLHCSFVGYLRLKILDKVIFSFLNGKAGNLFEHFKLAALEKSDFFLQGISLCDLFSKSLVLLIEVIVLFVESLFFLLKSALLLLELGAALLDFLFVLSTVLMDFILGLEQSFLLLILSRLYSFVYNALCFILGTADLTFGNLFAIHDADEKCCNNENQRNNGYYNINYPVHELGHTSNLYNLHKYLNKVMFMCRDFYKHR